MGVVHVSLDVHVQELRERMLVALECRKRELALQFEAAVEKALADGNIRRALDEAVCLELNSLMREIAQNAFRYNAEFRSQLRTALLKGDQHDAHA